MVVDVAKMTNALSLVGLGLLLGMRHATDTDHVLAVSTIVAKERRLHFASLIGIVWGIGHTATILLVGTAIILFHIVIPPWLGLTFEFLVAIALIVLGILNMTGLLSFIFTRLSQSRKTHIHVHLHDHEPHVHVHRHGLYESADEPQGKLSLFRFIHRFGLFQLVRPLCVGLIHGLAGSAAIALLILGTIADPVWALVYLGLFSIGTIVGMMMITTLIGVPLMIGKKYTRIDRYMTMLSGTLSFTFGLYLAYQVGVVDGLFTSHPVWDPY